MGMGKRPRRRGSYSREPLKAACLGSQGATSAFVGCSLADGSFVPLVRVDFGLFVLRPVLVRGRKPFGGAGLRRWRQGLLRL